MVKATADFTTRGYPQYNDPPLADRTLAPASSPATDPRGPLNINTCKMIEVSSVLRLLLAASPGQPTLTVPGGYLSAADQRLRRCRRRRCIRRSSSDMPPHIPSVWPVFSAYSRHFWATGQIAHTALAAAIWVHAGPVLPTGKKPSVGIPAQAASARQAGRSLPRNTNFSFIGSTADVVSWAGLTTPLVFPMSDL